MRRYVNIIEVGPRDGLQNIRDVIATKDKITYIQMLAEAGCPHIEVTSFVQQQKVPQLADSAELYASLTRKDEVCYSALVPNAKGMKRAVEAKVEKAAIFISVSETFNLKNVNASTTEVLQQLQEVMDIARQSNIPVRGYIITSFGCPFEGPVPIQKVVDLIKKLLDLGAYQVSLGDTIGVAVPTDVEQMLEAVLSRFDAERIGLHMHDTRGTALANVLRGLELGITTFDTSAGGLGGCPFAPGAAGNLATEDFVYALNKMGVETKIDLGKLAEASRFMEKVLGYSLPSKCLVTL
ncbi:MAG: Hydroxymethylglutaryl-CoA lyase YngG [Syntrophomonadaceae bacterium]|nr:Hydroxymethylglutaryl-CoA lyase YngG [Bacillota bacterium]